MLAASRYRAAHQQSDLPIRARQYSKHGSRLPRLTMLRVPARPLPATVCHFLGQQRDLSHRPLWPVARPRSHRRRYYHDRTAPASGGRQDKPCDTPECGFASAKHQLIECEPQRICRLAFSAADIVGVPDGVWYTYGVFLHCMVRHVRAPRSQSVSAKY